MASDLSSGCTDDIDIFEDKEEGELSLEDVSSSEESHLHNYRSGYRPAGRCTNCLGLQICALWCEAARAARKNHKKQDAAHGKENRRHIKDPSSAIPKPMVATLQEKNDDLVPISSDSDMEIVGLPGNSKQLHTRSKSTKVRKKKKKKRSHSNVVRIDDSLSPTQVETYLVDVPVVKKVRASRSHHRKPSSPPRYSERSPLERTLPKSPSRRYRSTRSMKLRSPLRRSRSPVPRVNAVEKKSPRKLRSPRRSSAPRSPSRSGISRDARDHESPTTSQTHIDVYATKLLQKVRRLETVGGSSMKNQSKNKEHSSLKEKLSNMMKNHAEVGQEKPTICKRNKTSAINNNNNSHNSSATIVESDDEDDIEVLRRLALETKQKKSEKKIEETKMKNEGANADESDDNDVEANELRMLALQSAVLKKHEKRVTRGVKPKRRPKSASRVESPFNESFLDDIRISGDEDESIKAPGTSFSPILDYETNHPEDMDIDTDVEREKEKDSMPYSPTDDLSRAIVMEVETRETNCVNNEEDRLSVIERNKNVANERNASPGNSDYRTGVDTPYSPSAPIDNPSQISVNTGIEEISNNPSSSKNFDCVASNTISYYLPGVDTPFSPAKTMKNPQSVKSPMLSKNITTTESPYSPTDTPILDPLLFPIFPNLPVVQPLNENTEMNGEILSSFSKIAEVDQVVITNVTTANEATIEVLPCEESKNYLLPEQVVQSKSPSTNDSHFEMPMRINDFEPVDTVDKLPEVDLDGSPLVPVSKELESVELVIPIEISPAMADDANAEPLYLRCLSDVREDTKKIPTVVNRTLVPAHILKTNKQLQQPLPQKKVDNHAEASFKSAEMRPVSVEKTLVKLPTMFKPIKLCPISKKSQVMTTMAASAFNVSFGDDSIKETKTDDEIPIDNVLTLEQGPKTLTNSSSNVDKSQKVDDNCEKNIKTNSKIKRRRKLRDKRRSSAVAESPSSESNRESIDNRAKSGQTKLINASGKKSKSVVCKASEIDERTLRASIKKSLVESWENFKDNVLKDDKKPEKKAANFKSEKATTSKPETSEVDGKKKKSRRGGRKFQQRRLASISRDARNKSSDLDLAESTEHAADKSLHKQHTDTNKDNRDQSNVVESTKEVEESERKRRCSIDEDEEALRAQLLASLPKRTKTVVAGVSTPPENSTNLIDQSLNTTTKISVQNSTNNGTSSTVAAADPVTSVNPLALPTQSSKATTSTKVKVELATTKNTELSRKIVASKSNSISGEPSLLTPRKRPSSVIFRGPPKKIVKKALPVLASTKVVNNAKKYQNALIQKKLNLQRAALNYGAQNISRNITLNNLKNNDCARPSSPKISAASKTQRLVINLGSDSDSETELDSQPENSSSTNRQEERRKPLTIPTTDFEKSVVQFLKDQRKKLESVTVSKQSTSSTTTTTSKIVANTASPPTGKLLGLYNTPLAVRRHLPMSQQEEYRRLKQQIAEREREKLRKTMENGPASSQKSPCTPPGPLSPASAIAAVQKTQNNDNKSPGVANELATNNSAPSNKNKTSEKPIEQKKIELVSTNDNRLAINVTKAFKIISPAVPTKPITKPLGASSKFNLNIPNIPSSASAPKATVKVVPKASSSVSTPKSVAMTSTPKTQSKICYNTHSSISSKASLLHAKKAAFPAENSGMFGAESSNIPTKIFLESSASISTAEKHCRRLSAISIPSLTPTAVPSASRSSLKPTEMLTIQIPNDKIQDRLALTGISRSESSSPPNGRNVGMLKILTKEQLNSRFVQIKVKQGPTGRTVTVAGPALSQDNASRSASTSPINRICRQAHSDQLDKNTCCDSSLIINDINVTRRRLGSTEESMIANSETSTLVLSEDEKNCRIVDSEASTLVLDHENSRNERIAESEASTLVLGHDISERRESPKLARTDESEDGSLTANVEGNKKTKLQFEEVWEKIRSDVKKELEILTALPDDQQQRILRESQENLVAKRNMVLDDLTEMSGCLRQWEVEREIQTKLIAEVRRLREQLRAAEKHLQEQRRQMNGMGPKVTKAHEKINHGRRECYKLSRICYGLGTNLIGEEYKVPDTSAQLLNERLKEVAVHTRQLSKKKVPPMGSLNDSRDTTSPASSTSSDTVSEMSFVERPFNSETSLSLSCATSNAMATNFLSSEHDLDANRVTVQESAPPEHSTADFPDPNPMSEISDFTKKKDKNSETDVPAVETNSALSSTDEYAQNEENKGSSCSEMNTEMLEKDKSDPFESDVQANEKEVSNSAELNTNCNSDVPTTNLFSIEQYEDISMPSTSKSVPHREPLSSDDQPPVKSKIEPYKSVLTHLKASRSVNPDGILCPYELMGTCSDGDCQYYHLDPGHCQ